MSRVKSILGFFIKYLAERELKKLDRIVPRGVEYIADALAEKKINGIRVLSVEDRPKDLQKIIDRKNELRKRLTWHFKNS